MGPTVKINSRPPRSVFSVTFRGGTPITDSLKDAQYEFGQQEYGPVSRAEAEARLQELLSEAEAQRDELEAASWSRRGTPWTAWLPWTASAVALIALCVVLIRQRGGTP